MSRHPRFATIVLSVALPVAGVLAGCAPGLAADPRFATDSGAGPQGQPESTSDTTGPPPIEVPKNDLPWHDCTARV
ncbi:MAG: alpha/beta hydrolase, partial [Mycobacterium sp.]